MKYVLLARKLESLRHCKKGRLVSTVANIDGVK
jgi:hypothetical protein